MERINNTESEKLDEIPSIECKEELTEEDEAPMPKETHTEDMFEAKESEEIVIPEHPSTENVSHHTCNLCQVLNLFFPYIKPI